MRTLRALALIVLAATFAAPSFAEEDLLAAARKARARREELKKKRKARGETEVLDNSKLKRAAEKSKAISEVKPGATPIPVEASDAAAPASGAAGDEKAWRKRLGDAQKGVEAKRKEVAELNERINDLRREASSIDEPNLRNQKANDLIQAEAQLPQAQAAVTEAEKAVENVREEARKAGAPPGWVR